MGLLQEETFANALKLALAAGILSPSVPYAIPVQMPVSFFAPPIYDFMNPTTTKPSTTFNPFLSSSTKTLRPLYAAIPLYTIVPLHTLQPQLFSPQWTPSPPLLDSAFWEVVKRTAEYSLHGAAALTWLLSEISKTTPEKDQDSHQDAQELSSYDSLDLSSLPSTPTEDDLLRMDMTELESMPSSELYLGGPEPVTALATLPRRHSIETGPSPPARPSSSATTMTTLEGLIAVEELYGLIQIPDEELYFDLEDLGAQGATPPWTFDASVFAAFALFSV